MMKMILALTLAPFFAFAVTDKELLTGKNTTPLKMLCRYHGGTGGVLVQFVKDNQADPGLYTVTNGMFYPANKIVRISYEYYGENFSKVGHLDNGGKVIVYFSANRVDIVGNVVKSNAFFGDDATLYNCEDLKLK